MEIKNIYKIYIENIVHYLYDGICDGIPTKWITKTKWNGRIKIVYKDGEIKYMDDEGNDIVIFDVNDIEYKYY